MKAESATEKNLAVPLSKVALMKYVLSFLTSGESANLILSKDRVGSIKVKVELYPDLTVINERHFP